MPISHCHCRRRSIGPLPSCSQVFDKREKNATATSIRTAEIKDLSVKVAVHGRKKCSTVLVGGRISVKLGFCTIK